MITTPRADSVATAKRPRIFPGWWVVLGSFIGYIVYSAQFNSIYGIFITYWQQDFGWSRGAIVGATTLARVPEAIFSPMLGPFVDRHGGRNVLLVGSFVLGLSFILVATLTDLWQLYLFRGILIAVGGLLTSPMIFNVTVSNWFVEKRGRAGSLVRMGDMVGTGLMPLFIAFMIEGWNWRAAWIGMGVMAIVLMVPASRLFHRRPEDLGLLPDGAEPGAEPKPRSEAAQRRRAQLLAADVVWTKSAILHCPAMWALVFVNGLSQMGLISANIHLVPYVQGLGYPLAVAAIAVGSRAWVGLFANPFWGWVVDRAPIRPAATAQYIFGRSPCSRSSL
jgi:sugar phosphate permease